MKSLLFDSHRFNFWWTWQGFIKRNTLGIQWIHWFFIGSLRYVAAGRHATNITRLLRIYDKSSSFPLSKDFKARFWNYIGCDFENIWFIQVTPHWWPWLTRLNTLELFWFRSWMPLRNIKCFPAMFPSLQQGHYINVLFLIGRFVVQPWKVGKKLKDLGKTWMKTNSKGPQHWWPQHRFEDLKMVAAAGILKRSIYFCTTKSLRNPKHIDRPRKIPKTTRWPQCDVWVEWWRWFMRPFDMLKMRKNHWFMRQLDYEWCKKHNLFC